MRLNAKFHTLTMGLSVIIAFIFASYTTVVYKMLEIKSLQNDINIVQIKIQALSTTVLEIEGRPIDLDTFYDN